MNKLKKHKYSLLLVLSFFATPVFADSGACSYHGGVNCFAGPTIDGKVMCNDGWVNSSVSYSSMEECRACPVFLDKEEYIESKNFYEQSIEQVRQNLKNYKSQLNNYGLAPSEQEISDAKEKVEYYQTLAQSNFSDHKNIQELEEEYQDELEKLKRENEEKLQGTQNSMYNRAGYNYNSDSAGALLEAEREAGEEREQELEEEYEDKIQKERDSLRANYSRTYEQVRADYLDLLNSGSETQSDILEAERQAENDIQGIEVTIQCLQAYPSNTTECQAKYGSNAVYASRTESRCKLNSPEPQTVSSVKKAATVASAETSAPKPSSVKEQRTVTERAEPTTMKKEQISKEELPAPNEQRVEQSDYWYKSIKSFFTLLNPFSWWR